MANCTTLVLWDCNGKLQATLFGSRREAFKLERVSDQMGMIAVKVCINAEFDPKRDYLVRQVNKNGRIEDQLVFGTLPLWAGGQLRAGRCLLDSGSETARLLSTYPAQTMRDRETRHHNGIDCDDNCNGK